MKITRFMHNKKIYWGIVRDARVRVIDDAPFNAIIARRRTFSLDKVTLLVPSLPSKIILAGLNYTKHARELNAKIPREPILFLKPPSTLIAHKQCIRYPRCVRRLDYEAELALVIGKTCHAVQPASAQRYILGYTCLNDITARDLQARDGQWTRAKSFDTFCPVGPWIETDLDPRKLTVSLRHNGVIKQSANTNDLIFSAYELVSFASTIMTLYPGDIISTGTPSGIGTLVPGDTVSVTVCGIGTLENYVSILKY